MDRIWFFRLRGDKTESRHLVAVCVEGRAAEGTLDQFKADVVFLLAGPTDGEEKIKEPCPFI